MPLPEQYVRRNLAEWAKAATGIPRILQPDQPQASGAGTGVARPDLPYLGLSRLPGTWDQGLPRREVLRDVETAWTLSFAGVGAADPAGVVIGDELVEVEGLATGAARDAWLDAFAASFLGADGWLVAASSGASGATLATGAGWAPPPVRAGLQVALAASASAHLEIWRTPAVWRYRLQVYGSPTPEAALGALRRESARTAPEGLRRVSAPTVLSIQSGADREVRGYVDLEVGIEEIFAVAVSPLASVGWSPYLMGG